MKFCENIKVNMLKIIIIIIGYYVHSEEFHYLGHKKIIISNVKKLIHLLKKNNNLFVLSMWKQGYGSARFFTCLSVCLQLNGGRSVCKWQQVSLE
jgi:uncharacterized membrane protein (Fun14 family)